MDFIKRLASVQTYQLSEWKFKLSLLIWTAQITIPVWCINTRGRISQQREKRAEFGWVWLGLKNGLSLAGFGWVIKLVQFMKLNKWMQQTWPYQSGALSHKVV